MKSHYLGDSCIFLRIQSETPQTACKYRESAVYEVVLIENSVL